MVYTDKGIYTFRAKKKWTTKPWKDMKGSSLYITKWEKTIWKGCILYDFNYDIVENTKNMKMMKRPVVSKGWVWEGRGWLSGAQRIFREVKVLGMVF